MNMEEKTTMRLSVDDRKQLKSKRRMGCAFLGIAAMAVLLYSVFLILLADEEPNMEVLVVGDCVIALLGWLVCHRANRDTNADLQNDEKVVYVKTIDRIEMNLLVNQHDSTSTAFNYRLTKFRDGYEIVSGRLRYPIATADYERFKGPTQCEVHYAPKSCELLGVYPVEE